MRTYIILIADDLPENIQIISDALKGSRIQHKIIRATNGKLLCELAEKRIPDLIITDWEMPEMDGIEAIKYLKNQQTTKDIPIIMCTGIMTTSENLQMALESGAVDYIRKPIDKFELHARVYSMLKLSDSYRIIKEQISVLEKQQLEILVQKEKLLIANATKDKFFSIIAHDLKNPFSSIKSLCDLMVGEYNLFDEEERKQCIAQMSLSINNTSYLLENLLTWARTQRDQIQINMQLFVFKDLIDSAIKPYLQLALNKDIVIVNNVDDKIKICSDKYMLETVIGNIFSNSIKYSNNGGEIIISGFEINEKIHLLIKDCGIGMDEKSISKLFRIDEKVISKHGTSGEKGTGLGLILCKEFIEKLNGKIEVESRLGEGATFKIILPLIDGIKRNSFYIDNC